jgi:DNA-directed RNA polymerase subunit alpha
MYAQMAVFNSEINISIPMASTTVVAEETPELKKMVHKIDELGLSARSYNCLDRSGIVYVGEIAIMSETELRDVKNLGKKSLDEIKDKIAEYGFDVSISLPSDLISAFKNKIEK